MAESGEEDLAGWDEACRREAAIRDLLNRYPKRLRFDDFLRHSSPGFRRPGILLLPRAATIFSYSAAYLRMFRPDVSFQTAEKNGTGTILRSNDSATGSIGSKSVTRLRANQGTALRPASTVYPRDCRLPKTPSEAPAHPAAIDRPPSQRSRESLPQRLRSRWHTGGSNSSAIWVSLSRCRRTTSSVRPADVGTRVHRRVVPNGEAVTKSRSSFVRLCVTRKLFR